MWKILRDSAASASSAVVPDTITSVLQDDRVSKSTFPNACVCPATHAPPHPSHVGVGWKSQLSIEICEDSKQEQDGGGRLNALLMLFVHKDIKVNVDKVLDLFAAKKSRRMVLANALADYI